MTGERCLVCILSLFPSLYLSSCTEIMTEHRTKTLAALLPIALATGYSEVEPSIESLKVMLSAIQISITDVFAPRTLTPAS